MTSIDYQPLVNAAAVGIVANVATNTLRGVRKRSGPKRKSAAPKRRRVTTKRAPTRRRTTTKRKKR